MGLEMIEVFMGIEERFDIDIPERDAERLLTVGRLHRYLCRRLLPVRYRRCETQRKFYQIRRALMRISELPRWYVRPDTSLALTLPAVPGLRRNAVRRLRNEIGVQLAFDPGESVSVGSLARLAVAQADARRQQDKTVPPGGWTPETIATEMKKVIVKQTEIDVSLLHYDARFAEDVDLGWARREDLGSEEDFGWDSIL